MFDFGAHTCRAGFAGEDTPKVSTFKKVTQLFSVDALSINFSCTNLQQLALSAYFSALAS